MYLGEVTNVISENGDQMKVVTDRDLNEGDYIIEHSHNSRSNTGNIYALKKIWLINKLHSKREAKGQWKGKTPWFYEATTTYIGMKPEMELENFLTKTVK